MPTAAVLNQAQSRWMRQTWNASAVASITTGITASKNVAVVATQAITAVVASIEAMNAMGVSSSQAITAIASSNTATVAWALSLIATHLGVAVSEAQNPSISIVGSITTKARSSEQTVAATLTSQAIGMTASLIEVAIGSIHPTVVSGTGISESALMDIVLKQDMGFVDDLFTPSKSVLKVAEFCMQVPQTNDADIVNNPFFSRDWRLGAAVSIIRRLDNPPSYPNLPPEAVKQRLQNLINQLEAEDPEFARLLKKATQYRGTT